VTTAPEVAKTLDVLTVGESLGLFVTRRIGPLSSAHEADIRVGGAESNVAIACSRLGARAGWVGRVGDDGMGQAVVRTLLGEGVQVTVQRDRDRPTGVMVKERRTSQHQRVTYYRSGSAASQTRSTDVPDDLLQHARVLHLTGITSALSTTARGAVRELVVRARAHGVTVTFDLNYRSALWSQSAARAEYEQLLPLVDVVFAGVDEAAILDPMITNAEAAWVSLSAMGVGHLVIKDGASGAHSFSAAESAFREAVIVPVIDTVGAGDAFVAGFVTAMLAGESVGGCLDRGVRAGALACMAEGDWEGAPTLAELELLGRTDPVQR
jgi:2-dehydro-3-deoxygluconokinase